MKKPLTRATSATRRQALHVAARALAVAELALRGDRESAQPERKPPASARAEMRLIAGRQAS